MLTGFHTYGYYNNSKVVTIRILAFLSGCILLLLKGVCSPLKKTLALNIRNLLPGIRLQSKSESKFAMFWPPDQESVPIMTA